MGTVTAELVDRIPGVRKYMLGGTIPGYESFEDAVAAMPATSVADETPGADMLYSSGTTGRPKGVKRALSGGALTDVNPLLMLVKMLYNFGDDMIYLSPAPLYHAAPLRYNMTVQTLGGTSIVMEHFDPEQALDLIGKYKTTHSQWVPTMFVRMLKLPEAARRKYDVSAMKVAIHAAAPCPIPIKKQMIEWWGPVIYEYYAGTEGNGFCAIKSEEWLAHPGSVGKSLLGELHIVGEDGNECADRRTGHDLFRQRSGIFLPQRSEEDGRSAQRQRLVDARRRRLRRQGRLPLSDRPQGLHDHLGRREHLSPRSRERADQPPEGRRRRGHRRSERGFRRGSEGRGAAHGLGRRRRRRSPRNSWPIAASNSPRSNARASVDFERELPRHPTGKLYKRLIRDRYWGNRNSKIV